MAFLYYKQLGQHGRAGNQLFQVASTIGIARANGMDPLFPAKWKYRSQFNLPDEMFGDCPIEATYKEPHFHFVAPDIDRRNNTEIVGYFQSERYWLNYNDEILQYLMPVLSVPGTVDAVCIHHRRGDYVGNPNYQQLGINYYLSAYDQIFKGKEIRAFSDDHNYIDLHYGGNTLTAKPSPEMDDFKNMIACKYHICSNSTFSWWAAYLSGSDSVVRPSDYFDGPLLRNDTKDFWPGRYWINWDVKRCVNILDTTFIIPFMHDHANRLQNIHTVLDFIRKHFDCCIYIGEINTCMINVANGGDIFQEKYVMPVFHRTKALNDLTNKSFTKYVFNYDADVVFSPWQIYAAVERLRNGADVVYPFGGKVANVPRTALQPFFDTLDAGVFAGKVWPWMNSTYKSVGMAVGYNKGSFLKVGGENECFISYGSEDQERYMRFKRLGLKVERVPGTAFHFEHWRGKDSSGRHDNAKGNEILFETEFKLYREWCRLTGDKDLWRPYNSTIGRLENW